MLDSGSDADLLAVHFPTHHPNQGCIVGERGVVLTTLDGARSWSSNLPAWTQTFYDVAFTDTNTGWVLGSNGLLMKTTNGGASWTEGKISSIGEPVSIKMVGADQAYVCGTNGLLMATLNGKTWVSINTGTTSNLNSVSAFPTGPIIAVGDNGTIIRSRGGLFKVEAGESGTTNDLFAISMSTPEIAWAVGRNNTILKTTDAGRSWVNQGQDLKVFIDSGGSPANSYVDFYAVSSVGNTVVVTGIGYILPENNYMPAPEIPARFYSTDGGTTWRRAPDTQTALNDLLLLDDGRIIGAGPGNDLYYSSSIIESFELAMVKAAVEINALASGGGSTVYAVGDTGCIFKSLDAGITWTRIRSRMQSDIKNAAFGDNLTGWVVGDNGMLLQTSDGGESWKIIETGKSVPFNAVDATDPSHAWMVSENNLIAVEDGALTWHPVIIPAAGKSVYLTCVDFIDNLTGWVGGRSGMVGRTTNGGLNWNVVNIGHIKYSEENLWIKKTIRSLSFVNANTGWLVGDDSLLARTDDGGITWQWQNDPTTWTINGILPLVSDNFQPVLWFAVGNDGLFRKVTRASVWQDVIVPGGITADLKGISNTFPLAVYGSEGTIILSYDTGQTWQRAVTGVSADINSFAKVTDSVTGQSTLVAVGSGGTVIRSTDDGLTWTQVESGTASGLHWVTTGYSTRGQEWLYACGADGTVIASSDKGLTWESHPIDTQDDLNCIEGDAWFYWDGQYDSTGSPVAGDLYTYGDNGAAWRYSDVTNTWETIKMSTKADWSYLYRNNGVGYLVGSDGRIISGKISTAKELWQPIPAGTYADLKCIVPFNTPVPAQFLITGTRSTAIHVQPSGSFPQYLQYYRFISMPVVPKHKLMSVHFVDETHGWAVGERGVIIATTDGYNWTAQDSGVTTDLLAVHFFDTQRGLAAGRRGLLLATTDGGVTWARTDSGTADDILGIAVGTSKVWLVGENGMILSSEF